MTNAKNLYFSIIEKEDMHYLYQWFSDTNFLKYYDYVPPVPQSKDEVNQTFNDYETKDESVVFAIRLKSDNKIIGIAGFDDMVKSNKVATLFIGIGDKELRGKGYGNESLKILLDYGFNDMDFYRIQLNVLEFNTSAIKLYERAGFKREGVFRDFVLRNNQRYDMFMYGLLKHEYNFNNENRLK
jgi:RimJ/RimL family protein N-acetyltransferase